MFRKILIALDRSPHAAVVFEKAVALARGQQTSLLLFHCLSLETEPEASAFLGIGTLGDVNLHRTRPRFNREKLQQEFEQIRQWLQPYTRQAEACGISVEIDCRIGTPSSWICDRARSWEADLIVLGRRGHSGLSEFLLGSVSNYVVHRALCSVLVVQGVPFPEGESPTEASDALQGSRSRSASNSLRCELRITNYELHRHLFGFFRPQLFANPRGCNMRQQS
ncbi:MAG: universal stress protein [Cyanobacteriota bacterium]|nr:universal stress protein [Cyanobacteriota bacterium]